MANQIRIHTSCEVVQDVGDSAGAQAGITYSNVQLDGNADSRSWGGNYNIATAYTDADVCYWKGVVVSATSVDYLDDSGWTEASAVSDGTIPATSYVVAVEYVSQLGSDSVVNVTVSGEIFAALTPGESVVIPMQMGEVVGSIGIHDTNYVNGTREATVNVMIAGI
jgi:hypothetical protein